MNIDMKGIFFIFIYFLYFVNLLSSSKSSPAESISSCLSCQARYDDSVKRLNELESQAKDLRTEISKWMKMYQACQENSLNMAEKWMKIATSLAEKIIGLTLKFSKS